MRFNNKATMMIQENLDINLMEVENSFVSLKEQLTDINQQFKEHYLLQAKIIDDEHGLVESASEDEGEVPIVGKIKAEQVKYKQIEAGNDEFTNKSFYTLLTTTIRRKNSDTAEEYIEIDNDELKIIESEKKIIEKFLIN